MIKKTLLLLAVLSALGAIHDGSIEAAAPIARAEPKRVREIFVPFEDLNVILEDQPRRVLLRREAYEELKTAAQVEAETRPPRSVAIIAADYQINVEPGRAVILGELTVEVMARGIHAVGLDIAGVGLREATLGDRNAPIGRADDGRLELFVQGKGLHTLKLDLVAPLETTAATQILNYRLPTPAATQLRLTVPGDVEIKGGTEPVSRVFNDESGATRFELVPRRGDVSLVMTLNSRLLRQERVVVARSVIVDEVTEAYERLHATFSMAILHKAVDDFAFDLPPDFEVTHVQSPLLARWSVEPQGDRRILHVRLREQTTETVVLSLAAIRTKPLPDPWTLPRLKPLEIEGEVAVVGLAVEDRLKAHSIMTDGLIVVDTEVLTHALPASVFQAEPGAPQVRPVIAGYAPQGQFSLSARFDRPEAELAVTTNLLLTLTDRGQEVRGGFALLPKVDKCFRFSFQVPAGWQVSGVTDSENKSLDIERYEMGDTGTRLIVRIPQGIAPGQEYRLYFQAANEPTGWLEPWNTIATPFPAFRAVDVTRESGALAVAVRDDLTVRPTAMQQIEPLDEREKNDYGLGGVPTLLAYRFDEPTWQASLVVERVEPYLTARTLSFLAIQPDSLVAHYELVYHVEQAGTRQLELSLPDSTPASLSIRGLGEVRLKEYTSQSADGMRHWSVRLAERRRGEIRLAVDFQQPLAEEEPKDFPLPIVRADGVAYQSGLITIEGSAELNVEIATDLRKADVGELIDAEHQPGKRLLGAYRFVGDQPIATISVFRHPGHALPPVLVQRAELTTLLDANGLSQTAARFALRTKAPFLEVELPPNSELWSMGLDGRPAKPQRDRTALLISLPAAPVSTLRDLRIVYETRVDSVRFTRTIDILPPKLRLRSVDGQTGSEIPIVDLAWQLYPPSGFRVSSTGGTVISEEIAPPELALTSVANLLYRISGGVNWFYDSFGLARARYQIRSVSEGRLYQELNQMSEREDVAYDQLQAGDVRLYAARRGGRKPDTKAPPPTAMPQAAILSPAIAGESPADPVEPQADKKTSWALSGIRSLKIDLQTTGERVSFRSLGGEPLLAATLINDRRLSAVAWTLAGLVALLGLRLLSKTIRARATFVVTVVLATTVLPLITGSAVLTHVLNPSCYAACLLVPAYLIIGTSRWAASKLKPAVSTTSAAVMASVVLALVAGNARAADDGNAAIDALVDRLQPPPPVVVPADAILLPYDPDSKTGIRDANQLLVPYEQFVKLWNQAHPDKKLQTEKPPAEFALAGATYNATLEGDEYLLIEGVIDLEVFADTSVAIPLALQGGVLAKADLDGQPARLSVAQMPKPSSRPSQQAARPKRLPDALILLHVSASGRHRLDLAVPFKLQRPGGWRVAQGHLPAAAATALNLIVPNSQTELRLGHVPDRRSHLTAQAGETIATALGPNGILDIRWRPKVSEGLVDHSLTANSFAAFEIREDGLRVDWTVKLGFQRSEREFFALGLPPDYLVVKVEGDNIRGWEAREVDGQRQIEVTLLKPAKDQETITLRLWRRGQVGQKVLTAFAAPVVTVPGAALQQGQIVIHRSPLLNLRTIQTGGVTRTDLPAETGSRPADGSPLGIRPYQAYRFAATPFAIQLEAEPVQPKISASLQTILRIAERERNLETKIICTVEDRPLYRLQVALPEDLKVERVDAPGPFEWAVSQEEQGPMLSVYLARGQRGEVPIVVSGTLGKPGPVDQVALPHLAVLDVDRQQGDIVVQADPAYDVQSRERVNCETILFKRTYGWLKGEQRSMMRLAVHYDRPDYSGTLNISARQPRVRCYTVSNVRVTGRAIEETLLLDFTIRWAGIREVAFLLPGRLRDARISVPQLRQKTVEPTSDEADAPVRVHLELQDKVMGQLRVLIEHDRLLTPERHAVSIPIVETGQTNRRYVLLESAGPDELVVESTGDLEPLSRKQKEWNWLVSRLGNEITQGYIVQPEAEDPSLTFRTRERAVVETVGARIGLAETLMVVDANGTYRAAQTYRVHNTVEQYLEIELPAGAMLWTASVAGEPVKPTQVPDSSKPQNVRIPLVKTAAGDLDYAVLLKYGGQLSPPRLVRSLEFPFIRTINIHVALSQVRLYLPETHDWIRFSGTMSQADNEAQLAAGFIAYQTRVAERLTQTMQSADDYAKVRAVTNLGTLKKQVDTFQALIKDDVVNEAVVQKELESNTRLFMGADRQVKQIEEQLGRIETPDNRAGLNDYFDRQSISRSRNVATLIGSNFEKMEARPATQPAEAPDRADFDTQWFSHNRLNVQTEPQSIQITSDFDGEGKTLDLSAERDQADGGTSNIVFDLTLQQQQGGKEALPLAPNVIQEQHFGKLQQDLSATQIPAGRKHEKGRGRTKASSVARYRSSLQEQRHEPEISYGYSVSGLAGADRIDGGTAFGRVVLQAGMAEGLEGTPTGLASLYIEIPLQGQAYFFTTPRGDVEIAARAVSKRFVANGEYLIVVLIALAVLRQVWRLIQRKRVLDQRARTLASAAIIIGVIALLVGFLPIAGMVVAVVGLIARVQLARC